jgi:hypothetical protein
MYISYKDLSRDIESGNPNVKNYFDTFGFVVIQDVLDKKEFKKYLKEYDAQYEIRANEYTPWKMLLNRLGFSGPKKFGFRKIAHEIFKKGGMTFLPGFIEESEEYVELFLSKKMQKLFSYFCGDNWLYLGSDGSKFITTSFPWHRDWLTKIPIMKCNFYFNPLPFLGGKFLFIPGSNFESDVYAQMIQKCMSWPMQNKTPSGLNENDRIPIIKNPRNLLKPWNLFQKNEKFDVPYIEIRVRKGDLVLFDHRALHCVQSTWPRFQRRLLTFLIGKNAFDFKTNHYALNHYTREALMTDLVDLVVNERNHIGCDPWGKELLKTEFINTTHFIDIKRTQNSVRYDRGEIRLESGGMFSSQLDFDRYSKIGKRYRETFEERNSSIKNTKDAGSQEFSYKDVHLGINSQNIRDIES